MRYFLKQFGFFSNISHSSMRASICSSSSYCFDTVPARRHSKPYTASEPCLRSSECIFLANVFISLKVNDKVLIVLHVPFEQYLTIGSVGWQVVFAFGVEDEHVGLVSGWHRRTLSHISESIGNGIPYRYPDWSTRIPGSVSQRSCAWRQVMVSVFQDVRTVRVFSVRLPIFRRSFSVCWIFPIVLSVSSKDFRTTKARTRMSVFQGILSVLT